MIQVVELREKEEAEEEEAAAAAKAAEAAALMHEANLSGVDNLFDDMTAGDDEWAKLAQASTTPQYNSALQLQFTSLCNLNCSSSASL
jgi:septal ring factor EnvC (AmiA/AmiB activator)